MKRQLLGLLGLLAANPAAAQSFDFRQPQHSFLSAGGASGVLPDYPNDEIDLDQNRDGLPDGTWNLPSEIQSIANTVLQHRLSPTERYLITIRSPLFGSPVCGGAIQNIQVFFHRIDPEPVLVLLGSDCVRGPVSIGPLWWDQDSPPANLPRTSMVVGGPDAVSGIQPVLWADLVNGEVGVDSLNYEPNVSVTAEGIRFAPFGNAVFVRHGTSTSFPDRYSIVDLCADPLGGIVSTQDEPSLTTGLTPRLIIEGANLSAEVELLVAGSPQTRFFELDDCSLGGPPPPPPPPDPMLTVTVIGTGTASVGSLPAGLQCPIGGTCNASFARNTVVTLQALTGAGTGLIAWGGDCSGTALTSNVLMSSDRACTATFGGVALEIEKTAQPASVRRSEELLYTLTFRNTGTAGATGVLVRDTVPSGATLSDPGGANVFQNTLTWNVGTLPAGGSGQRQFRVIAQCSASELRNSAYSIASSQFPLGVTGAPVVTPVLAASTAPVGVVVSSVPARTPLRSGDLVTHTVTLTNTAAELRRGLRFVVNPGGDAAFDSVLDPGTGTIQMTNPFNWVWTGDLGPNASTDVVFTTRIDDCIQGREIALGSPIDVQNSCGVPVGQSNAAPSIPLEAAVATELRVLGLPPERLEPPNLLVRPNETFQLQIRLTERHGQDQPSVSIDLAVPAGLTPVGDPPFMVPTDPAATWDPVTRTASWSGTVPANGAVVVTVEVQLDAGASCRIFPRALGRAGTCANLSAGLNVLKVPAPPTSPYLMGLDRAAGLFVWEPGVDRNFAEHLCLSPVEILIDMDLGDGNQVAVSGLPAFLFDSDPTSLEIQKALNGGPFLGVDAEPAAVAHDSTTNTWVYAVQESTSSRPNSLRRLDPSTGQFTVIANGLPWLWDLQIEPDGTIAAIVIRTAGAEIWRIDPSDPSSPDVIADPAYPSLGQLALDPAGGYVAIHFRFDGTRSIPELIEIDPVAGSFTTLVSDLDAFLGLPILGPYAVTVAGSGEIYVANRRGAVGVIERTPTLSGRLLADSGTVLNPRTGRLDDNYTALLWVDPGGPPPLEEADLELTKTASSDPVMAGASLVYTLGVTNHGPDAASAVAITDPLPAGVSFDASSSDSACTEAGGVVTCDAGDLASGAGASFAVAITTDPGLAGDLTNTAVVTSDTADPDPGNNESSVTVVVLPPSSPEADLSIVKTASPDPALLGAPLTYTLSVTNDGPDDASNVTITDALPAGVRFDASASTPGCTVAAGMVTCVVGALAQGAQSSANVVVVPELVPDLAMTRIEVLPDRAVRVGDTVLYRFEVTNHGPGIGEDVRLFTLGSGFDDRGSPLGPAPSLTALSVITSHGVCPDPLSSVPLECLLGDLLPGETAAIDMAVRLEAPSGNLPRSVGTAARVTTGATVATGIRTDPDPGDDELTAGNVVAPSSGPDLHLRALEVAPADPIVLGGSLTYTIEVENLGPDDAPNVVLYALARSFDPSSGLPDGPPLDVSLVSAVPTQGTCTGSGPLECALGLLPVGASAALQIVVTPTVASVSPGQPTAPLAHRARVAAAFDPNPTNDEAGVDSIVLPSSGSADLAIAMLSAAPKTPILLGQSLTYTIEVKNFGPDAVSDASLFALARGFDGSGMPVGPPLDVKVDSVAASQGACLDVGGGESGPVQCDLGALAAGATVTVTIETTPRSATVGPGQIPAPLLHAARVGSSTLDLSAGNDEANVASTVLPERPSALLNRATVSGNLPDPDPSDDSDTISTPLAALPLPPAGSANVTLALDGPGSGTAGEVLPFTIDVTNMGPDTAAAARVVVELSRGLILFSIATNVGSCAGETVLVCELGDFPAGGAALFRLDVIPLGAGTHQIQATVSSPVPDPAPSDNSAALTVAVGAGADLELTKSAGASTAVAGGILTYELSVSNRGPSPAMNVVLHDLLPAGLSVSSVSASQGSCQLGGSALQCDLGILARGASAEVTLVTNVLPTTPPGSVLVNEAQVAAAEPDPSPANNRASASVSVVASADLSIQKNGPVVPVPSRDPVRFELTVQNEGPSTATSVSVVDPLPAGTTFDAAGSDTRCSESGASVTCVIGDVAPGAAVIVGVSLNAGPGTVVNSATVSAVTDDPDPSNDTDTATVTVFLATDENMDPGDTGAQYAWSENLGWLNLEPSGDGGPGVEVSDTSLRGYLWGENFGWCSLSCQNTSSCASVDYEVANDGQGNLSGFAWCENVGWLSFSCDNTSSCGRAGYGVRVDPATGVFSGEAWGENVGWVSFSSTSGAFETVTSWRGAAPPPLRGRDVHGPSRRGLRSHRQRALSDRSREPF